MGRADVFGEGIYANLDNNHVFNNDIRSFVVPEGLKVTFYEQRDFGGNSFTVTGPANYCDKLPDNFLPGNVGSFKVTNNPLYKAQSRGKW